MAALTPSRPQLVDERSSVRWEDRLDGVESPMMLPIIGGTWLQWFAEKLIGLE